MTSKGQTLSQASFRPGRVKDAFIALCLLAASTAVLAATDDMGFVRDEAFYFAHAETYQDWFVRLEKGGEERKKALQRKEILEVWHNNSEHPPLDKMLFGWSWRLFGRKLRPLQNPRLVQGRIEADIGWIGASHGFEVGSHVSLLKPQMVGSSAAIKPRTWLVGEVITREAGHAVVRLERGSNLATINATCGAAGGSEAGQIRRTSCEFLEQRKLAFLSESQAMRLPGAFFGGLIVAVIYLAGRLWFAGRQTAAGVGRLRRPFALTAAIGYLCIPQAFYHAHLATFDTTIAALLLLTTLAWHRALRSKAWVWITALLWGVSLLAKHNALFLPVPLILHWLWNGAREGRVQIGLPRVQRRNLVVLAVAALLAGLGAWRLHPLVGIVALLGALVSQGAWLSLPAIPVVFFAMLPIGMAVLVAGWPLLWVDTLENLLRWIEFHLNHEHYMQVYFGKVLAYPPFPAAYPWVMTALTWTLPLLAAFALGMVVVYAPRRLPRWPRLPQDKGRLDGPEVEDGRGHTPELRSYDRLVLLSALWPMALISMPGTPIFGGTKHWMGAYPFMLLIAARGVQAVWQVLVDWARGRSNDPAPQWLPGSTEEALARSGRFDTAPPPPPPSWLRMVLLPWILAWGLCALLLVPAAQATADVHPHGTAYFNELIGGLPGAARAGMQRQFWGGATRDGLEEVNRRAPANASIWFHKSAWGAYAMYQREGWFRRDLRYGVDPAGTTLGLFHHQRDHDDYDLDAMRDYDVRTPVMQSAIDGVPVLSVYERPAKAASRAP